VGHEPGPQMFAHPAHVVRGRQRLLQRLGVASRQDVPFLFADLLVRNQALSRFDGLFVSRPAYNTESETNLSALFSKSRNYRLKFFGSVDQSQPTGPVVQRETLRLLGMPGYVDLRRRSFRRRKLRVQFAAFNPAILAAEAHFSVVAPE